MSLFNKVLGAVGIGAAKVDTQLDNPEVEPGGEVSGLVKITGGKTEQNINKIDLDLICNYTVEIEREDSEGNSETITQVRKHTLDRFKIEETFTITPGEVREIPFAFTLSEDAPLTVGHSKTWIDTNLDIEMALDKDTLIRKFFIDNTAAASQFVPPKLSGFNNNAPSLGYDQNKAKELLAEAGYKGEVLKFYYPLNVTRPYLPTPEKVYAEISRQLTAVGLNIKPVPVDWSDGYLQKVTSPGDHALHLLGWNGSYADPDNFVGPLFGENTGEFDYQDPQVFSKISRARGLPDGKDRTEQYQTINAQIAATVPAVPIAFPISALALSDRVLKYPASPVLNEVFTNVQLKP